MTKSKMKFDVEAVRLHGFRLAIRKADKCMRFTSSICRRMQDELKPLRASMKRRLDNYLTLPFTPTGRHSKAQKRELKELVFLEYKMSGIIDELVRLERDFGARSLTVGVGYEHDDND